MRTTVHIGLNFHSFEHTPNPRGSNCCILSEWSFPVGLRGLQHLLCRIDLEDLRPERGGTSLEVQLARQPFDGPGLDYRIKNFGTIISQYDYEWLLNNLLEYLDKYNEVEYTREMREYISGQLGLLFPMAELEKLYVALAEDNQVGDYFYPIPGRFWETFLQTYEFQHLSVDNLFKPVGKAAISGVKAMRKSFRDNYNCHDFRYKG